jgi:5-methylcytosine-specific restriction endonuclease McrA
VREWAHNNPKKVRLKNKRREEAAKKRYGLSLRTIQRLGLKVALKVYDRDKRRCKICGNENNLVVHHKDFNGRNNLNNGKKPNNSLSNLVVLCTSCHGKLHSQMYHHKKTDIKF